MSTTTNFKRIALVAVAALGMGLLSSAPSQAAIGANSIVLSTTAGTAVNNQATANQQDSATGALVSVQFLSNAAVGTDSITIELAAKSKPSSTVSYPKALLQLVDTSSGSTALTQVKLDTTSTAAGSQSYGLLASARLGNPRSTLTSDWGGNDSGTGATVAAGAGNSYAYAQFRVFLDTATTRTAGAYVYTVIVSPFENSLTATAASVKTIDVTITVGSVTLLLWLIQALHSQAWSKLLLGVTT